MTVQNIPGYQPGIKHDETHSTYGGTWDGAGKHPSESGAEQRRSHLDQQKISRAGNLTNKGVTLLRQVGIDEEVGDEAIANLKANQQGKFPGNGRNPANNPDNI